MATIPTPRSYPQILGDMIDAFKSRTGLKSIKVGNPILSMFEAVAQSNLRSTQDIFQLLNSSSLDRAEGTALERIAADEGTSRQSSTVATGQVTIGDSTFTKIASTVFAGKPAPLIGTATLYVSDASTFPATGQLYIGRGTTNYEGPLTYTGIVNSGTYYTITLDVSSKTTKYHNLGESVVVAQGGTRTVPANTVTQTTQGSLSSAIKFVTLNASALADGEDTLASVWVVAQTPGASGNASSGSVREFGSAPFSGATVTNPLSFRSGRDSESDFELRDRIRSIRQSRSRGTKIAIETAVTGLVSEDDNKRIASAKLLRRSTGPSMLYVDDGTGYEPPSTVIDIEYLTESALGGEQTFQIQGGTPIAKAYVETTLTAPFALSNGGKLAFSVGGTVSEHTFNSTQFESIGNASGYEVVSSINGNPNLLFSARTANNGSTVRFFAKDDTNDDIVSSAASASDMALYLGVPSSHEYTLRLYKNGQFLTKDGLNAKLLSAVKTDWSSLTSGETLILDVDGTGPITYTFYDWDLIPVTAYSLISNALPLSAWVALLNSKLPGVTASVSGGQLALTSNGGKTTSASLSITGGTLVSKGMFAVGSSTGQSNDYSLDRNTGQIELVASLPAGDSLACGFSDVRGAIVSDAIGTVTLASDGLLWFVVDGAASIVATPYITMATSLTFSSSPANMMKIVGAANTFANIAVGDWLILWDTNSNNKGHWRVADIDSTSSSFIRVETSAAVTAESITLASLLGTRFVHTDGVIQKVTVPAGVSYTASSLATTLSGLLSGATFGTYQTNKLKVATNAHNGDISLVAADTYGQLLALPLSTETSSAACKTSVVSSNTEVGTPFFGSIDVTALGGIGGVAPDLNVSSIYNTGDMFVYDMNKTVSQEMSGEWRSGYGANRGFRTPLYYKSGSIAEPRNHPENTPIVNVDKTFFASSFACGPNDTLSVLVDGDTSTKSYSFNTYRVIKPKAGTTLADAQKEFVDNDNADATLATAFGIGFDFNDFAVYMRAREVTHEGTVNAMLWRYYRYGSEGEAAQVAYTYPRTASTAVSVSVLPDGSDILNVGVSLPTGAVKSGALIDANAKLGLAMKANGVNGYQMIYIAGLYVSSITFDLGATVTATLAAPTGWAAMTDCGLVPGDVIYFTSSDNVNYPSGQKTLDSVAGMDISWTEVPLAGINPLANAGSISVGDSQQVVAAASSFSGAGLVVGDIANIDNQTRFGTGDPTGGYYAVPYQNRTMCLNDVETFGNWITGTTTVITGVDSGGAIRTATVIGTTLKPLWRPASKDSFTFYPINAATNTTPLIASAVNALAAAANSKCPVTAVALDPTGVIAQSTEDEFLDITDIHGYDYSAHNWHIRLCDGVHYIANTFAPATVADNYKFNLKESLVGPRITGAGVDYDNELMRLAPVTAKGVVAFLNCHGVSALPVSAIASETALGGVQLESRTDGASGSIQISGGAASSASAAIAGSGFVAGSTEVVATIPTAGALGFVGGKWVKFENALPVQRQVITPLTTVQAVNATTGQIELGTTKAWTKQYTAENVTFSVRKQGKFAAYMVDDDVAGRPTPTMVNGDAYINFRDKSISCTTGSHAGPIATLTVPCVNTAGHGYVAGDHVTVVSSTDSNYPAGTYLVTAVGASGGATQTLSYSDAGAGVLAGTVVIKSPNTLSAVNLGYFKVVAYQNSYDNIVWVENPNAVEEVGGATFTSIELTSIIPGDKVSFTTNLFGGNMRGEWTVVSLGLDEITNSQYKFNIVGAAGALPNATAWVPGQVLNETDIVVRESAASSVYGKIVGVYPNQEDGTYTDLIIASGVNTAFVSSANQTSAVALDKLEFPTAPSTGKAGYEYYTGLIGIANKVVYGDETNPTIYPGVAAVGANINIDGPIVKRLSFSLSIRTRTGAPRKDIETAVKNAVAALVNSWPSGESIAISEVVSAVQKVGGVIAVTVLYPSYTAGNDTIAIALNERPLVLNATTDITVAFVGA